MSNQLRSRYDIIINGGGPVGFSLLNLILKSPYLNRSRVLLIEQAVKPRSPNESVDEPTSQTAERKFSNRVSSITLSSKSTLRKLGIWESLKPYAKDVTSIKVWNYDYMHKIVFKQNLPACYQSKEDKNIVFSTVENNRLTSALLDSIRKYQNSNTQIAWNSQLENLSESLESGLVDVTAKNSETSQELNASAPLVLGCDGFRSKVRDSTQIKYREFDLHKTAVVGTVRVSPHFYSPENDVAYQRFSAEKDTVAALLPLSNEFSSFVISAPTTYAQQLMNCDDEAFVDEFNQLLSKTESSSNVLLETIHNFANATYDNMKLLIQILPKSLKISTAESELLNEGLDDVPRLDLVVPKSRASFPLIFGTTSPRMIGSLPGLNRPQVALLGDASHRIHPLAGQGLNLGLQDASELVRQLETIARSGGRIFDEPDLLVKALRRYELRRQAYVMPMSASILAMQNLFSLAPSRMISSLNKCDPVKTISVRVANGV